MRDGISCFFPVKVSQSGSPAAGVVVDTLGYDSLAYVLILTSAGAGTFTITHSDASDMTGETTPTLGTEYIVDAYGSGSTVHKLSYLGNKRYVRVTHAGAGTMAALLGHAHQQPV